MIEPFILTQGERNTPTWTRLVAHYEARLAQLRKQNDGNLDDAATRKLRGRIAEIKNFLALNSDKPFTED